MSGRLVIYFNFDGMAIQKHQAAALAAATTTSATRGDLPQKRLYETDLCTVAKIKIQTTPLQQLV